MIYEEEISSANNHRYFQNLAHIRIIDGRGTQQHQSTANPLNGDMSIVSDKFRLS
jgi:hypothetical protein